MVGLRFCELMCAPRGAGAGAGVEPGESVLKCTRWSRSRQGASALSYSLKSQTLAQVFRPIGNERKSVSLLQFLKNESGQLYQKKLEASISKLFASF